MQTNAINFIIMNIPPTGCVVHFTSNTVIPYQHGVQGSNCGMLGKITMSVIMGKRLCYIRVDTYGHPSFKTSAFLGIKYLHTVLVS
jgi:hypothetical protein